ncbi:DUF4321 domain-containing protein [Clostridium formicaceticum]|uniref:DUF4321 domain-containing protein n=1 Tax=Clostridium formicaceticum TaxID=1497 RepID=A0AAC9RJN4_9CLOT|nr:DUF4321 domain-containing protein [Clostridium formicaceticum]AOY76848.1 hypothetical protein BJL90_13905 [Clostridium formicaceticum]ARE87326.1 hypothetical protein CLFO_17250 [Clostridium formicaceticum]
MSKYRNPLTLMLLIITGVVLGSLIGTSFGNTLPILSYGPQPLGLNDLELDLGVVYIRLTLLMHINFASLLGLLLAVLIFNKL